VKRGGVSGVDFQTDTQQIYILRSLFSLRYMLFCHSGAKQTLLFMVWQ
jgi:hypothetical protein